MAPRFHSVARFYVFRSHSYSLEAGATRCFESPDLWLAFRVFDLQINPRMRHDKVHFFHYALNVHERIDVVAVGVMRPHLHYEGNDTERNETYEQFEAHDYPPHYG